MKRKAHEQRKRYTRKIQESNYRTIRDMERNISNREIQGNEGETGRRRGNMREAPKGEVRGLQGKCSQSGQPSGCTVQTVLRE